MLVNESEWQSSTVEAWDEEKDPIVVVAVKQNFEYDVNGNVYPDPTGAPVVLADDFDGEGLEACLTAVSEVQPYKTGFEVYGELTCFPPTDKQARVIEVGLKLGCNDRVFVDKLLRVTGERVWKRSLFGPVASDPQVLSSCVLNYQLAYGGTSPSDEEQVSTQNPLGRGYKLKNKEAKGQPLPQVEYANQVLKKPSHDTAVASFAAIPPFWSPRVDKLPEVDESQALAGKFPFKEVVPAAHYQVAPQDQQTPNPFSDGWWIEMMGLTPDLPYGQSLKLALPRAVPRCRLVNGPDATPIDMQCDTLVIDSQTQQFSLIWRGRVKKSQTGSNSVFLVEEAQAQGVAHAV
ncbi:DUF2169 family type VI secretion system accessory protein [Pseudoalteromonas sp. NC201]|uniref:DUF2169 family type VI secretion system accessory protein n=1 Tax=Pseudoalteromonas sp. NC201 TaxID=1514074 RepID=UPI000CA3617C|nr:DUF2169 domain-containing protein [Pseudoalteromonas sp. NC201]AUJ70078.1 hypothetical protein PNC201_08925 [Pseudoalteromonas sp. NC201]